MFTKILIANRGEIACRVARTARRMGVATVAVYSEADAEAQHVNACDEAVLIGPAPARDSYLKGEAIVEAAKRTGAQAIHPGYGFLSENAEFAEACEAAGLVFIGPPASAIKAMGSKSAAKEIMEKAGVPLVPGYHGRDQGLGVLGKAAEEIGYPVLIKASAGGGGKGMRVVEKVEDFSDQLLAAKREAQAAFGDDKVLIEKYLTRPRHIEVQVFADAKGNCVHLFERDCSVQRRHQKVLEEAPAPKLDAKRRKAMGEAAVKAAEAIGYVGAGTVEFIADEDGSFYFMEMNTRLQVEHPVTEMVTGEDLVEWQLRVASGEKLPRTQKELSLTGHAFEARLYAEDPRRNFLPATGRLAHLRFPAEDAHTRVDTGVQAGDEVSIHYDPMIAKIVAWDSDRGRALARLRAALAATEVVGVTTNRDFLLAVAGHEAFGKGEVHTGFIGQHEADLIPAPGKASDTALALAALAQERALAQAAQARAASSFDPYSPWHLTDGWRLNDDAHRTARFRDGDEEVALVVNYRRDGGYGIELPSGTVIDARGDLDPDGTLYAELDGRRLRATIVRHGAALVVFAHGDSHRLETVDPLAEAGDEDAVGGQLTAPMPGKILEVLVEAGAEVDRGAPLVIMEAMKMEHTIAAPVAGTVSEIFFAAGEQVDEGAELIAFEAG